MVYCTPVLRDPHFNLLIIFLEFLFLHMCQCSLKSPQMMVGKKLYTNLSPIAMVGPPPVNPNAQISHVVSPVQSSHANKKLKTDIPQPVQDKGKAVASPSSSSKESSKSVSSRLHLKDDFSHVINAIQPQGSNQPKAATEKSREDNSEKRQKCLTQQIWILMIVMLF
jgi:hypothetical protein